MSTLILVHASLRWAATNEHSWNRLQKSVWQYFKRVYLHKDIAHSEHKSSFTKLMKPGSLDSLCSSWDPELNILNPLKVLYGVIW